ncbi:hypothetical protein [Alloactinosynnema sp. L-07]|uniref:hypothetical protein n=1 Tax=Alloactinosynnema sp. L-07 TaxID=1653480 RepID=UPI00065F0854|nr:hypothetical protein [Alloactinosynnema sp. L-07]CRK60817.1 hypothetical protein [Alloactinosynnema sp. L-07]
MNIDDELQRLFADERLDLPVRAGAAEAVVAGARRVRRRRVAMSAAGGAAALSVLAGAAFVLADRGPAQSVPGSDVSLGATSTTTVEVTSAPQVTSAPTAAPSNSGTRTGTVTKKTTTPTTTPFQPEDEYDGTMDFGPTGYLDLRLGMTAAEAEATGLITPNAQPTSSRGCLGYDYKGAPKEAAHYSVVISPKHGLVRLANGPVRPLMPKGIIIGSSEADLKKAYPTSVDTHGAVGEWVVAVPGNPANQYWVIVRDGKVAEMRLESATQDCYE